MAATERAGQGALSLLAAALALPGVAPAPATAQTMPETGLVQFKYLDYRDWQPGADRMSVQSPSLFVLKPLPQHNVVVEASLTYDAMSGASPIYHNVLSGASGIGVSDYRTAGDFKVTTYRERFAIGAGVTYSHERDYISRGGVLDLRTWTEDKNTTVALGFGGAADRINTVDGAADHERRNVVDFLAGVTQAINPTLILQSNLTWSRGHGYYDDPYKPADRRPDTRRMLAWLTRLNQHFPEANGTLKVTYRYVDDSWGADSHMLELGWFQGLPMGFSVTPGVRYYMQDAAYFYQDPRFPQGFVLGEPYTADTRLSAFGAFTLGVLVGKEFDDGWSADLRVDFYRQKSSWRAGGNGSPGLEPFSARWIQVGVNKAF